MQDHSLFPVTFVDLQLIINSIGSTEVNAKEYAGRRMWDLLVVASANNSSFQAGGFRANLGQFWFNSSSGNSSICFQKWSPVCQVELGPWVTTIQSRYKYIFFLNVKNYTDVLKILKIHHLAIYSPIFFSEKQANILILIKNCKFHPPNSPISSSITEATPLNQHVS